MRLTALSAGYAIPDNDFNATIHSVFRTAVNLRPETNDLLLTLVVASEPDLPQGIRLDSPDDFSFGQLVVGGDVYCRNDTIIFEDSALRVESFHSNRWRCDLPALGTNLTEPAIAEAWEQVWQLLNERQERLGADIVAQSLFDPTEMTPSAISRRMGDAIHSLIEGSRSYKLDDLSALTQLIGLGAGLTPSGDDFVIGYMAGLWCTVREFVERRQFVSKLGQAVIYLAGRTNDISRTYLYYAANGQVSSRLDSLAKQISKPKNPGQLRLVAESAMQSGHTSGMDAVSGLLFGLATWDEQAILSFG